ncbi:MAG: DUF4411 family protein [Deltaproteobacteria bacterium]|nr:DUF4411 family protein [Deltaproteobacteria bacterium]
MYLLDANVLITANRTYYPIERVPEYWAWLVNCGNQRQVKIPQEMYDEINQGKDDLKCWLRNNRDALLLDEDVDAGLVKTVLASYASDLNDVEIEAIGADPFLIAYALVDPAQRRVVTTEGSKPSATRANRKIPDVCRGLMIGCDTPFELNRTLNFSTNWQ